MNKYVSKIDGKVFETKEELMKHLESTYVYEETNEDSEYSNILSKLKEAFPEADIDISKQNNYHYIELTFNLGDRSETFSFTIESEARSNTDEFTSIEEAIEFYVKYPKQTELIREALADRYELEHFEVDQWIVASEWDNFGHHICLNVILNGIDMHLESGIGQDIDSFIHNEVEFFFKNEFEGALTSNYDGWHVGNVSVDKILDNAKRIRITILE